LLVSPYIYDVLLILAALTKKKENVAKTSVTLDDVGLFQHVKKCGLYIRIDFQALVYGAFYF